MPDRGLSDDLRQFIEENLDRVEQLEVLLLLKSRPEIFWDAASVASSLGVLPESASQFLEELATRNLLDVRIANTLLYRYAPGTDRLAQAINELSKAYQERRTLVLKLLMAKPHHPIRDFAKAFKVWKEKKRHG